MNLVWIENARREFIRVYGERRGPAVCAAVVPGVMGDFRRMLERAAEGETVWEEYRTDDGKTTVRLAGCRRGNALIVTGLTVGGRAVDLGAAELVL